MSGSNGEYLFELLTEEIPAWMLDARLEQLEAGLRVLCSKYAGEDGPDLPIAVGATSRRIYLRIQELPRFQKDRLEEIKGPPLRLAYDSENKPTKALLGFLRKNQAGDEAILPRGESEEYVRICRTFPGLSAVEFLSTEIPALIESLRWPKLMRWSDGSLSFIRPVHSIISIYEGEVVPLRMLGVVAGRQTEGHRILSSGTFEVTSFDDYAGKLTKRNVVLAPDERVRRMRESSRKLAREVGGNPAEDSSIWNQWKYLTEAAGVVRSSFNETYLSLPHEVLITVMRIHQKQLPILNGSELTNHFLAAMDNVSDPDGNGASGNAFVTNARFADARFFYDTDRKTKLAERDEQLKHLQFQEKLGNYFDKRNRIQALVGALVASGNSAGADSETAARLCKSDLVTEMVKEFTDLQGQIGGIYAREEGYPETVWQAIYDHYRPVSIEDSLPRSLSGALVAVADKADTLCGFFLAGIRPSGSKDPFGLRRAAQGIVQLLLNRSGWQLEIALSGLIDLALANYPEQGIGTTRSEILQFMEERVRTVLQHPVFGFAYDEIDAAMAAGWTGSLPDLMDRVSALRSIRDEAQFISILDSARRISNIVGKDFTSFSEGDPGHASATRLASLTGVVEEQVKELTAARNYKSALESFAGLAPELEAFFRDVMVMVDDSALKNARLTLLHRVGKLVSGIADVTRIVVNRRDYDPAAVV